MKKVLVLVFVVTIIFGTFGVKYARAEQFCYKSFQAGGGAQTPHCYTTLGACSAAASADLNKVAGCEILGNAPQTNPNDKKTYELLAPIKNAQGEYAPSQLPEYIKFMYQILISLSAVLAILIIVYGGILYMSTDAIFQKYEGKAIIKRALWGLIMVIGSAVILGSINPALLNVDALGLNLNQLAGDIPKEDPKGGWCIDVHVVEGGRILRNTDCSAGNDENLCKDKFDYYNGRPVGFTIAKQCYERLGTQPDFSDSTYCIDINLDSGEPFKNGADADCVKGKGPARITNTDRFQACMAKAAAPDHKNDDVSRGCQIQEEDDEANHAQKGQYCLLYVRPGNTEVWKDCVYGSAYKMNDVALKECEAMMQWWQTHTAPLSPDACKFVGASTDPVDPGDASSGGDF